MSLFAAIAEAAFAPLDAIYGETILVQHVLASEFTAGAPDPAIPAFSVVAPLDLPRELMLAAGSSDGAKSELVKISARVEFDAALFSPLKPAPVAGTILTATDRAGHPRFRVRDVEPDGVTRIVCEIAPLDLETA
ncbi:hypothetical protein [Methylovirgula sp. 4M-Z18]|uniref:hypothetical protein n=1 Tax=Methylovirgula sp. 4M-Z18 TaxID=2293567 RepID=UPI000E2F4393|nr:hypothetical protein [Methylovirgula sp. 4M-Z18]RFB80405.1 hypothetical protein DYH55_02435 [Methylovirgula sp. 4M-Z18]